METNELIAAIKNSVRNHTKDWARSTVGTNEQQFCQHNGVLTLYISKTFGISNAAARHALNRLVKQGLVLKSDNNLGGYCRWWPVGHLKELREVE